jgi:hypothetical protein
MAASLTLVVIPDGAGDPESRDSGFVPRTPRNDIHRMFVTKVTKLHLLQVVMLHHITIQ